MTGVLGMLLGASGAGHTFSITAGTTSTFAGYSDSSQSHTEGTLNSGDTMPSGKIISVIEYDSSAAAITFAVRGFSSGGNPLQASLVSLNIAGKALTGAGANNYGFAADLDGTYTAKWKWTGVASSPFAASNTYVGNVSSNGAW